MPRNYLKMSLDSIFMAGSKSVCNCIYFFPYLVEGLVVGRGVVAMASAGWGVAKGEELSTSPIAASSCRINVLYFDSYVIIGYRLVPTMYLGLPSWRGHDPSVR
jgi:hypothetical protein